MSVQYRFIQPLDILNFRGNKSFGEAGEHGESQMPPQPSIFAGALRSFWLASEEGADLAAFAGGKPLTDDNLHRQLGTPESPGSFRISRLWLARKSDAEIQLFMPLPADLVVIEDPDNTEKVSVKALLPQSLPPGLQSSHPFSSLATLRALAEKPKSGYWLNQSGMENYLLGKTPSADQLVRADALWQSDERLGIALQAQTRTAEEGKIYTTESIALRGGIGFVAAITGADDYPPQGTLRLGGDGRAASMGSISINDLEPDWQKIRSSGRFKLVLSSPALFTDGWNLPGIDSQQQIPFGDGVAVLECAAVGRFEVISGWDLANWRPKPARRVTPTGSVYWLKDFTGSIESLQELNQTGIGLDNIDLTRKAEGYNNFMIANWN